jgi:hypothetical protein
MDSGRDKLTRRTAWLSANVENWFHLKDAFGYNGQRSTVQLVADNVGLDIVHDSFKQVKVSHMPLHLTATFTTIKEAGNELIRAGTMHDQASILEAIETEQITPALLYAEISLNWYQFLR